MANTSSLFIIDFGWHHYQYHYHTRTDQFPCGECDKIYNECNTQMLSFLKNCLITNKIRIALEEGGTCLDIHSALEGLSLKNTILQEAIQSLRHQKIFHRFVDITQEEVEQLIEQHQIRVCADLHGKQAELRDPYMANQAIEIFSRYPQKNGLLLCAGRHFSGVTQRLATYVGTHGTCLHKVSLSACSWYKTGDQILDTHIRDHVT